MHSTNILHILKHDKVSQPVLELGLDFRVRAIGFRRLRLNHGILSMLWAKISPSIIRIQNTNVMKNQL
jgi:hypothetical protein